MSVPSALVTGSTSGIGLAIAESLAQAGYHLMLHGLGDPKQIQTLTERIADQYKVKVHSSDADLMNPLAGSELVKNAESQFGRLDVLVNNAGIQHVAAIEEFPTDRWDAVIAINLSASFHTIKAALPGMRARNFGRVINIASAHGLVASPLKSAYVAAKHGLVGLTKVTALETAETGITCNAICPGWVKTPLVVKQIEARAQSQKLSYAQAERDLLKEKQPSGRFVDADEIANLVLHLADAKTQNTTGSIISIDGGWLSQ